MSDLTLAVPAVPSGSRPVPEPPTRGTGSAVPSPKGEPGIGNHSGNQTTDEKLGNRSEGAAGVFATTPGTNEAPREALESVLEALGDQELAVLVELARRLLDGQRRGRLDLANGVRDFRRERAEELADAMVYDAVAEVAASLREGRR